MSKPGGGQAKAVPAPGVPGGAVGPKAEARSVVLGTAGHIDHGKTALVLALTGTDTDRLPEEKARGITIDLGFAAMELVGPGGQRFDVSLIDVPGHHAFVRNMLAGAGGIDAVMLVVAADEGVKAQTVEHLQICRLLGIRRGLVVLTKLDAVSDERLREAQVEVAGLVQGIFLEGAPVLAVSALKRQGLAELKARLARLVAEVPARSADATPRLPVDRVFTVRGFGTVVTGTLQAGRVRAGESWVLEPSGKPVRVRGVQVHGRPRAEAAAPNRVALNLAGVDVADVTRGDTLVPGGALESVRVVDVEFVPLEGDTGLRHRQRVRVHGFAAESLSTVLLYGEGDGSAGGVQLARLRLAHPMVLVPGDALVLRLPSPARTLGGARVLDAHPLPRLRKAATAMWLRSVRELGPTESVCARVQRRGLTGLSPARLAIEMGATAQAVARWLAPALAAGKVVTGASSDIVVEAQALTQAEGRVVRELQAAPDGTVPRALLRSKAGLAEPVFALAVARLQNERKLLLQGEAVRLPGASAHANQTAAANARASQVEAMYRAAGLASPLVNGAAERLRISATEMRTLVTGLLRAGKLVRMGSDALLVHREALDQLTADLRRHPGRSFDVAWFKGLTGLSRKHAIPLLEYLDGARVTRNVGGQRTVL